MTNQIAPVKTRDFLDFLATPIGGSADTIGRYVLDFLKDLSLSNMPELRRFNRQAMVYEARAFLGKHAGSRALVEKAIASALPRDIEIEDGIERLFQELNPLFEREKNYYLIYREWKRLERKKNLVLQEADPEVRKHELGVLFFVLNNLKEPCAAWEKVSGNNHARALVVEILLHYFAVRCVSARFQAVIARGHLNPSNPEEIASCFRALHESQRRAAFAAGGRALESLRGVQGAIPTWAIPTCFKLRRFSVLENEIQSTEQFDHLLCSLWNGIKQSAPAIGGPPLARFDYEADQIRPWLNDPANAIALRLAHHLRLERWQALPPEIGRFTGLRDLTLPAGVEANEKLTGFPEEMASLQELRSLDLLSRRPHSDLHDLREISPVIGELRALEYLDLSGPIREIPEFLADLPHLSALWITGSQVRAIPDRVWRHVYLRNQSFGAEFWRFLNLGSPKPDPEHTTFGINPRQLTDTPFSLWLSGFETDYLSLEKIVKYFGLNFDARPVFDYIVNAPLLIQVLFVPVAPIWLATAWILYILQYPFNLPLFLYNITLRYVMEPLLSTARDALGYSRMVRV